MTERQISPSLLFNKLTAFSYSQDPDFKRGESDVMKIERTTKLATANLQCEETKENTPLYDEKTLLFYAERAHSEEDFRQSKNPASFKIQQEIITQLPGVPTTLREQLEEQLEGCDISLDSGNFNKVQYVHYSVDRDEDDEILIDRNIGYILRDYDDVLYETSELIGQPEPEYVPIAHNQQSLRVYSPIKEDSVEDQIQQVSFNAIFEEIFDGASNMHFYHEFVKNRDIDAVVSILSLVRCLKERRTLPDHLLLQGSRTLKAE